MRRWTLGSLVALAVLPAACADADEPIAPETTIAANGSAARSARQPGAVYLMSNAAGPNQVLVYERSTDGALAPAGAVATGGDGTGAGLGNQGALALTDDGRWLLVVNPGSDDVSLLRVTPEGLTLADRAPSGGDQPISVTVHRDLVYVLHGGAPNGISALRLQPGGELQPLPGSSRPLSADAVAPAQIGFSPDGRSLVVTEKGTSLITTYRVDRDGLAHGPTSTPSAGATPFGFAFNRLGTLVVSEAGGTPTSGGSTLSSYELGDDGSVHAVGGPLDVDQAGACWIAISNDGRFAYSTNAGSGSLSGVRIGSGGSIGFFDDDGDGVVGITGAGSSPLDADFSRNGRYLFVLSSGVPEVSVFRRHADGSLTALRGAGGLPATANGLAAW